MSDFYRPPRVHGAHLTHVGVFIAWAKDSSYCRGRYLDWNVMLGVDPLNALDPEFRKAVEERVYLETASGPQ